MPIPLPAGMKNGADLFKLLRVTTRRMSPSCSTYAATDNIAKKSRTADEDEIMNFSILANKWWDEEGDFKALHSLNKLRVPFVRDGLINSGKINHSKIVTGKPLMGVSILDVGCGGGIMSEPLARLGAQVIGLDASQESIATAELHAKKIADGPKYVCETIEDHAAAHSNTYDALVLSEVIEHIQNKDVCLQLCMEMLKPGGSIFITTINRTWLSWMAVIVASEYVLRFIPVNTHHYDKFISPIELQGKLRNCGFTTRLTHGMVYNILCNKWMWSSNTTINYALHAIKCEEKNKSKVLQ